MIAQGSQKLQVALLPDVVPPDTGITQLTGDVTAGPGSGSQAATIPAGTITLAKLANLATAKVIGRSTAGTGVPEALDAGSVGLAVLATTTQAAARAAIGAGTGSGSVTDVSVTTANGVSGSVATSTTTPAITLTLGAITPTSAAFSGTGGNGFIKLLTQSSNPTAPASGFSLFADASGRFSWRRASDGFTRTFELTATADRVFTIPDASFTLAGQNLANSFTADQTIASANRLLWSTDLILSRKAAANLQLGGADAAAPVAQTLSVQSVVAGTTDTAGVNWTISGSRGTGTGAGGSIIFQTAPAGSTASTQNALVAQLTLPSAGGLWFGSSGSASAPYIFPFSGTSSGTVTPSGTCLSLFSYQTSITGSDSFAFAGNTQTPTSSASTHLKLVRSFAPTSGTATHSMLTVQPTINQTGGANGITRGLYINPTLTAAADFRALEISDGKVVIGTNGALSAPAVSFTGTPITGGTATTTKPLVLVETAGATSTAWNTSGTMLGINSPSGFAGTLLMVQANGSALFQISSGGAATITAGGVLAWSGRGSFISPAAGQIQLGAADAASAVAQTLSVQSVVAGTSNTAGADWTLKGSLGTGTGASGNLVFQLGTPAASGSTQHSASTGLTLSNVGTSGTAAHRATFAGTVATAGYTVATLPAAGTAGRRAYVTDATAPTYLGALTGGGAVVCPVFDNGVAWVSA